MPFLILIHPVVIFPFYYWLLLQIDRGLPLYMSLDPYICACSHFPSFNSMSRPDACFYSIFIPLVILMIYMKPLTNFAPYRCVTYTMDRWWPTPDSIWIADLPVLIKILSKAACAVRVLGILHCRFIYFFFRMAKCIMWIHILPWLQILLWT